MPRIQFSSSSLILPSSLPFPAHTPPVSLISIQRPAQSFGNPSQTLSLPCFRPSSGFRLPASEVQTLCLCPQTPVLLSDYLTTHSMPLSSSQTPLLQPGPSLLPSGKTWLIPLWEGWRRGALSSVSVRGISPHFSGLCWREASLDAHRALPSLIVQMSSARPPRLPGLWLRLRCLEHGVA